MVAHTHTHTHKQTNSKTRVMRNSSSSLVALVSALSKQRPVVDAPDIWVLFFLCVCVYVYSCWDSPWLNQASYTSTSSQLHLSLSVEGLMSSLTPPPSSLTFSRNRGRWGKMKKAESCRPSFIPIHLGSVKKPKMLAVTNRAIKLYGPAEHATLLMLREVMQKWLHPHWWIFLSTYYYDIGHSQSCKQRQLKILAENLACSFRLYAGIELNLIPYKTFSLDPFLTYKTSLPHRVLNCYISNPPWLTLITYCKT